MQNERIHALVSYLNALVAVGQNTEVKVFTEIRRVIEELEELTK